MLRMPSQLKAILLTSAVWFILDLFLFQLFWDCSPVPTAAPLANEPVDHDAGGFDFHQVEDRRTRKGINFGEPVTKQRPPGLIRKVAQTAFRGPYPDGPGEGGRAVSIPADRQAESDRKFKVHQFNLLASELMSVNRTLPDYRMTDCRTKEYPIELPDTSVIIVFHNEAWSTLLRTLYSVINRSPPDLLNEIILVDDASTMEELRGQLDEFVKKLPVRVLVERMPERSGLVKARLHGAALSQGQVLTFLDAHCECTIGWLEPLLLEVKKNPKAAACPIIDVISDDTFEYSTGSDMTWGGFNWKLQFRWFAVSEREQQRRGRDRSVPIRTPTMAGGLFSIDKQFFYDVGAYDPGYIVWGGENLEMSFRLWQCGGEILIVTCSRVGHVFRKVSPYEWPGGVSYVLNHNSMRTAMVWMDEYKDFYLRITPGAADTEYGDITERVAMRERLQCKSFSWYLKNIYPEGPLPLRFHSLGYVKTVAGESCLDTGGEKAGVEPKIFRCHNQGGNQLFSLGISGQLMNDGMCVDGDGERVRLQSCSPADSANDRQRWRYNTDTQQLVHASSGHCLEAMKGARNPSLSK